MRKEMGLSKRRTRLSWTSEQIQVLLWLIGKGASAVRASVILKRPKLAVKNKARQLGSPFPDVRVVKKARLIRETLEIEGERK
jgi:hypothetical protein